MKGHGIHVITFDLMDITIYIITDQKVTIFIYFIITFLYHFFIRLHDTTILVKFFQNNKFNVFLQFLYCFFLILI